MTKVVVLLVLALVAVNLCLIIARLMPRAGKTAATAIKTPAAASPSRDQAHETPLAQSGRTLQLDLGEGVSMELAGIPAGEFMMGSTPQERVWAAGPEGQILARRLDAEGPGPRKTAVRDAFWIGRTEVTVAQWRCFAQRTHYVTDAERIREGSYWDDATWRYTLVIYKNWKDPGFAGVALRDDHPVTCISWNDAAAFCEWLTQRERVAGRLRQGHVYRLPTEAEWEYAARGGRDGAMFWWGSALADGQGRLNIASQDAHDAKGTRWDKAAPWSDGFGTVSPVDHFGQQGRNAFGLADMLGNVWEWCLDGFNPAGAQESVYTLDSSSRVMRGGGFSSCPGNSRCACRSAGRPYNGLTMNGFRVCYGVKIETGSAAKNSD